MKITNYKRVYSHQYRFQLKEYTKLNDYQLQKVVDFFENKYYVWVWAGNKQNYNPLWRLTVPFWLVFHLLQLLILPIKYILTGSAYFKVDSEYVKFYENWSKRLNL